MKPTQEQLNDPAWWDENAPEGYDYAFTTGPEWDGGESLIGDVRIANESGRTINGMLLAIGLSKWHKIAKRPTKPAFVPEVGVECEILCDYILCGTNPTEVKKGQAVRVHSIVDLGFGNIALISDLEIKGTGTIIFSQLNPIWTDRDWETLVIVTGKH